MKTQQEIEEMLKNAFDEYEDAYLSAMLNINPNRHLSIACCIKVLCEILGIPPKERLKEIKRRWTKVEELLKKE